MTDIDITAATGDGSTTIAWLQAETGRISATTTRQADLDGTIITPESTSLQSLREFVKQLEHWPGNARVRHTRGLVLRVTTSENADPLTDRQDGQIERR